MRGTDPLVKEIDRLSTPSGAALVEPCRYTAKSSSHRLYSCTFRASTNFHELLDFYSSQLERNGWHLVGQTTMRDWGRDFGGMNATFCKNELQIDLQYAGERASYGWQYALGASVGLGSDPCSSN